MTHPDGLFVYGTLRAGGRNHSWLQRTHPEGSTRAHAPGRLFHLPAAGYPAMVAGQIPLDLPPGPGWVAGEFFGYEDPKALENAAQDLDPLEDADGGLFLRRVVPVLLESGHSYAAYAYVFPEDRIPWLEREGVELAEGDWTAHLGGD